VLLSSRNEKADPFTHDCVVGKGELLPAPAALEVGTKKPFLTVRVASFGEAEVVHHVAGDAYLDRGPRTFLA
jgi:hypothetical protein